MRKTYWLYFAGRYIAGVRAPEGSTDEQVRQHALAQHAQAPLMQQGVAPYRHREQLKNAEVRA